MSNIHSHFHILGRTKHHNSTYTADAQKLRQQLLLTWLFISQEGLLGEAVDFLREYEGTPLPFMK